MNHAEIVEDDFVPDRHPDSSVTLWLQSNTPEAIDRLMAIYRPFLVHAAEQFIPEGLHARIDRSDLVQETLIRGLGQRDQFRGATEAEFGAWLRQILHNIAIDAIRYHTTVKRDARRSVEGVEFLLSEEDSPSQNVRQQELFQRITAAMSELTDEQRLVVELRSEGIGFREIGERTGRSEDAARMLWGRGMARLMEILRVHG